jgi:hypothetical protein
MTTSEEPIPSTMKKIPLFIILKKRTSFTRISKIEGNYTLSKPKDTDAQKKCIK